MTTTDIILLSGGVDSATALEMSRHAGHHVVALWVDYGQPAAHEEGEAVRRLFAWGAFPIEIARVEGLDAHRLAADGPGVVPGRNALLLACAVATAARHGARRIVLGATADDSDAYPDCRPDFTLGMAEVFTRAYGVGIIAPLAHLTKSQVVAQARELGVPLDLTWSCYRPEQRTQIAGGEPCGTCDACRRRAAVGL